MDEVRPKSVGYTALKPSVRVFGYGSLVNSRTRSPEAPAVAATLRGWERAWQHCVDTEAGKVCALTVVANENSEVDGVVIQELATNLPILDAREQGYRRIQVTSSIIAKSAVGGQFGPTGEVFTYISAAAANRPGSTEFPIWWSYLECVLAGYYELGGMAAAARFIKSTRGWDVPIFDDRDSPKYMRAILLTDDERNMVERLISDYGLDKTVFSASPRPSRPLGSPGTDREFG